MANVERFRPDLNEKIKELYVEKCLSIYSIAEKLKTNPTNVRNRLIRQGVQLRGQKEAQKLSLANGARQHPTKGRKHTSETKLAISESMSKSWDKTTHKERLRRAHISKENYDKWTDEQKEKFSKSGAKAMRKTAVVGSKLEIFLRDYLRNAGYNVKYHYEESLLNGNLQLDLFLPELVIAIEVDGIVHHENVFTKDTLSKRQQLDAMKNGLVEQRGWNLIRIKNIARKLSVKKMRDCAAKVVEYIEQYRGQNNQRVEIET